MYPGNPGGLLATLNDTPRAFLFSFPFSFFSFSPVVMGDFPEIQSATKLGVTRCDRDEKRGHTSLSLYFFSGPILIPQDSTLTCVFAHCIDQALFHQNGRTSQGTADPRTNGSDSRCAEALC